MMSSNSRTTSPGKRLAIAAFLATAGLGLAACGDDSKSNTGPGYNENHGAVGNVNGSVVDQNGAPLAGVTVALAGKTATTDVNGQYRFENVAVTGTASDGDTSGGFNPALPVTLTGPAGYMGATVTVDLAAQLTCTNSAIAVGNPGCVLADGFNVGAGTTELPQLNSTVKGVLRDALTGNPVAGATVELDFRSVQPDQAVGNGFSIAWAHPGIAVATTAADGSFAFAGVAADSCFEVSRTGYSLGTQGSTGTDLGCDGGISPASQGQLVNTNREGSNTANAGSLVATGATNVDNIAPYVTKVSNILARDANPGVLASGQDGTQGIRIDFSEAVANITAGDVQVVVGAAPTQQVVPFTLSENAADHIVVKLNSALAADTPFSILIKRSRVVDAADNVLGTDNGNAGPNVVELGFDSVAGSNLKLDLQTYSPFAGAPDAVLLTQVTANLNAGANAPFTTTSAFLDSLVGPTNNSFDANDNPIPLIGSAAPGDIDALNATLGSTQLLNGGQTDPLLALGGVVAGVANVDRDVARFTVDLSGAATAPDTIALVLLRNGAPVPTAQFYTTDTSASVVGVVAVGGVLTGKALSASQAMGNGNNRFVVNPNGESSFDVIVTGANPGDIVAAVSRNADQQIGGEAEIVLNDVAAPTTGLNILSAALPASYAAVNISGGGAIGEGTADQHVVLYPVTPQALDVADAAAGFNADELQDELDTANATYAATVTGTTGFIADATSMAAFTGDNIRLGVTFTEPLNTTLLAAPAYNGSAALTAFDVRNNQAAEDSDIFSFVTFNVDNIFKMEADGRGNSAKIIDFKNSVADLQGNVADADANARVLVRDVLPPMLTQAYRNADGLTFVFHEGVRLVPGATVQLTDCGAVIDLGADQSGIAIVADRISQSADFKTVKVPLTNPQYPAGLNCFPDVAATTYAEPAYDGLGLTADGVKLRHGLVTYADVPDRAKGTVGGQAFPDNTWTAQAGYNIGMQTAVFAAADLVGPFVVTGINCEPAFKVTAVNTAFDCDIAFSHALTDANFTAIAAAPATYLQIEDNAGVMRAGTAAANTSPRRGDANLSAICDQTTATCNVVRVHFTVGATAIAAGDRVNQPAGTTFDSAFDATKFVARDAVLPNTAAFRGAVQAPTDGVALP
ncbi:MAG TPA: Ig-like domain-containing protein [Solimonas sp.]|nr:Ig-like domain-containing protein [Solimonas sp.]